MIKGELTSREITLLEEHVKELPGVSLDLQPMRHYLYGESAAHVLGYVGEVSEEQLKQGKYKGLSPGSIVGKEGLEFVYDTVLRGQTGRKTEEVDVRGKVVRKLGDRLRFPVKDWSSRLILPCSRTWNGSWTSSWLPCAAVESLPMRLGRRR